MPSVLISGASVAGLTLAYWLRHRGFQPTIVERSPGPRAGGQAIDVRGAALEVVERMGLLEPIRAAKTDLRGMSFVDSQGTELSRSTEATLTGGLIDNDDVEIMRDDLTTLLSDVADPECLFGDVITSLTQHQNDVEVTFRHGPPRRFDLVLGADGLHSGVRRLVFGPEADFVRFLGSYLTIFTVDNFLGLDRWQTFHAPENGLVGVYSARHNTEARAMLRFASPQLDFDYHDVNQQKDILAKHFAGAGWETPRLLELMWQAPDFFFDATSQVRLDRWSAGRIALVGDAAYCASPRAGQGTSMALVGAYVLAGELAKDPADHEAAFARYQRVMQSYVDRNQQMARDAAAGRPVSEADRADAACAITLEDYPA